MKQLKSHLVIVGPSGGGKNNVAERIAPHFGAALYDTDLGIRRRFRGMEIPDIFKTYGEPRFRRMETLVLQMATTLAEPRIIVTGGGAVVSSYNRSLMQRGVVFWLNPAEDVIVERLRRKFHDRPLAQNANGDFDEEGVRQRYRARQDLYAEVANCDLFIPYERAKNGVAESVLRILRA